MAQQWKSQSFANTDVDALESVGRLDVRDQETAFVSFTVGTADLTAFTVNFRTAGSGSDFAVATSGADYTSPSGVVLGASGDLSIAAAGATTHWVRLDVRGVESILLQAAGTSSTIVGNCGSN